LSLISYKDEKIQKAYSHLALIDTAIALSGQDVTEETQWMNLLKKTSTC
jgi:hypothetical protein